MSTCELCRKPRAVLVKLNKQREISGTFVLCLKCLEYCIYKAKCGIADHKEELEEMQDELDEMLAQKEFNA